MNLYKKIIKKLYNNAFPENREKDLLIKQLKSAQKYTRILSVRVEPETIKASSVELREIARENFNEILDYKLVPEIAKQLLLRGLVRVVTTPDRFNNDMVNVEATVCAVYPGDLEGGKKNDG